MHRAINPQYGIDAPGLVRAFFVAGLGLMALSGALLYFFASSIFAWWLAVIVVGLAMYAFFMVSLMLWGSLVAKVRDREAILDLIPWRGSEHVLDIGCGRGLMVVGAALRLTTGCAVGVDIWTAKDQSDNNREAAVENARRADVLERVTITSADMRALPFADRSFDVILSSWAVHNVEVAAERLQALSEMVRLLRPSGVILLTDIVNRHEYAAAFEAMGLVDVRMLVLSPIKDRLLSLVTFGSFQPATIFARKML